MSYQCAGVDMKYRRIGDKLLVDFSPTDNTVESWLLNFMAWKKPYKRMARKWYVHRGFLKRWDDHKEEFASFFDEGVKEVHISGYSQGGAVAVLAHEWVGFHYPQLTCYTTCKGAPRCISCFGLSKIKDRFAGVTRFEHRGDIVCHLPPSFFGYRHVGERVRVGKWTWKFWKAHQGYGK
jgi:hypothetical protein